MGKLVIKIGNEEIDLPENFTIEREMESAIFNRELDRKDFTFPATIPLTDRNKRLFNHIDLIAIQDKFREYVVDIFNGPIWENQATLKILRVSTISKTIEISIIGSYGTFARDLGGKKLNELYLDGERYIGSNMEVVNFQPQFFGDEDNKADKGQNWFFRYRHFNTKKHMKDVLEERIKTDYYFFPAVDTNGDIDKVNMGCVNLINHYDWTKQEFVDPVVDLYNSTLAEWLPGGREIQYDQRVFYVPFFKTMYVLRKCFEENGYKVDGDIFSDVSKERFTIYNTITFLKYKVDIEHSQEMPNPSAVIPGYYIEILDYSRYIRPSDHMPNMKVIDFINEVCKVWNLFLDIDLIYKKVTIKKLNNINGNFQKKDISDKASPYHEILFENKVIDNYRLEFDIDPSNSIIPDFSESDLGGNNVVTVQNDYDSLQGWNGQANTFDLAYVRSENAYYQNSGLGWTFYSLNYFGVDAGDGDETNSTVISSKINPVPSMKHLIKLLHNDRRGNVSVVEREIMMPTSAIGIGGSSLLYFFEMADRKNRVPRGNRMGSGRIDITGIVDKSNIYPHFIYYFFFMQNIGRGTFLYPWASVTKRDGRGNMINMGEPFFWESPDKQELFENYWRRFIELFKDSFEVEYLVLTDDYSDNINDDGVIIIIHDQKYLIKKVSSTIPFPNISQLNLIRI